MLWINRFTEELKGLIFQNGENEVLWFIASLYAFSIRAYGLCWISSFNVNRLVAVSLVFYVVNPFLARGKASKCVSKQ